MQKKVESFDLKKEVEDLKTLVKAGRAMIPATSVIKNGNLINVMSNEIYPADVAIYGKTIVATGDVEDYIGQDTVVIDATGKYLSPGLIDGHIHSECSLMSITSFAKAVLPRGTTSIVSGLDGYISVSGLEGLKEVFKEIEELPMKVFWGAPFKTPYTIPESTVAFNFDPSVHEEVQQWDQCFGVWETVREFIEEEDEDTLGAMAIAKVNRLPVFGCAPMARGNDLNGYLTAGVRLDHESYTHEEVVEKIRKGMHMIIRESTITPFLEENIKAITQVNPDLARRVSFCTDDVTATDVLNTGHLDYVVRKAIKEGVKPMTAIQMATINSAETYKIDDLIGSISPGRIADILIIDSPETFNVEKVITNGNVVAENHKLTSEINAPERTSALKGKLKCDMTTKADFEYKVDIKNGKAKVLSMDVKAPFVRKRKDVTLEVKDGVVQPDIDQDAIMVSVLERHGRNDNKSLAFCSGWNLKKGAMASSACPDDNNIIVMGVSPEDMSMAVNHLIENGGGQIVVADGEIIEFLPLPVGGIVSDLEPAEVSEKTTLLKKAARSIGSELEEPIMWMFFLPITAIPDYAITDVGPVDYVNLRIFDPILELIEE